MVLAVMGSSVGLGEIGLQVPKEAPVGSTMEVRWTDKAAKGRVDVTKEDGSKLEKDGSYGYVSPKAEAVEVTVPKTPGRYGVVFSEQGKGSSGLVTFEATAVTASVSGPAKAAIGETVEVEFTGPSYAKDLVSFGTAEGGTLKGASYKYPSNERDGTLALRAPMEAGSYTLLYLMGDVVLAKQGIEVGGTSATVKAAATVQAGGVLEVLWTGPDNEGDFVTLHDGAGKRVSGHSYMGSSKGGIVSVAVPEELGKYEVVYVTGGVILARQGVEVVPVSATLEAKAEVMAEMAFEVAWTGPGNRNDRIVLVKMGEGESLVGYTYLDPAEAVATVEAPKEAGEYELRYRTEKGEVLATRPIRVVPAPEKPGLLEVLTNPKAELGEHSAIEVILDASGSMLKQQDGKRRIEIARETLISLITDTIPEGTPFALRVFGHKEADSCRTDLEVPLLPLDVDQLTPIIGGINAVNLAKTPIADSLTAVGQDLKGVTGELVVILLTDGEETCGGDPALAIRGLRLQGTDIRVNIVGYAIDDEGLKQSFESWAALGGGQYLNAPSGEELSKALRQALAVPYKVYRGGEFVAEGVSGGAEHELPAGEYEVRFRRDGKAQVKKVGVIAETRVQVTLP